MKRDQGGGFVGGHGSSFPAWLCQFGILVVTHRVGSMFDWIVGFPMVGWFYRSHKRCQLWRLGGWDNSSSQLQIVGVEADW